jgi:hypothetical protein
MLRHVLFVAALAVIGLILMALLGAALLGVRG